MILNTVNRLSFKSEINRETISPGKWLPKWRDERGYVLKYSKHKSRSKKCILFIHGGGFSHDQPRSGSYDSFGYILTHRSGYDTYIPDYTLSPDQQYPYQIHELFRIVQLLQERYDDILLGGDSAGGTIALQMALVEPKVFYSLFLISAWIDLHCDGDSYYSRSWNSKTQTGDPIFKSTPKKEIKDSRQEALVYLGKKTLFKDSIANPINADSELLKNLPPTLFLIGDREVIRDGTLKLAARAQVVNSNIFACLYEHMWHDWVLYSQKSSKIYGEHGINTIISFCKSKKNNNKYNFKIKDKEPLTLKCNLII